MSKHENCEVIHEFDRAIVVRLHTQVCTEGTHSRLILVESDVESDMEVVGMLEWAKSVVIDGTHGYRPELDLSQAKGLRSIEEAVKEAYDDEG